MLSGKKANHTADMGLSHGIDNQSDTACVLERWVAPKEVSVAVG